MGGLLVAIAVLATWWAATGGDRDPTSSYVVSSRAVAPGTILTEEDLTRAPAELPPSMRTQTFTDPGALIGAVVLGPLGAGELIQVGTVATAPEAGGSGELSFAVEIPRAVAGTLRSGDLVDVYATYGDGASAETHRILAATTVKRASQVGDGSLGESRHQVITVTLDTDDDPVPIVNATRAAALTVIRVTGTGS